MSRQVKLLEDDVLSLKRQLVQANSRIVELEAEVKRLEEALMPFARAYQGAVQHYSDSALVGGVMGGVTVGDLRRVAEALEVKV